MKKRILCFGDSNTYGLIPGTKKQYNEKDCYTGILNQLLGDNYEVFADGLCGRTTIFDKDDIPGRTSIRAIKESVNHYTPDILIIMLGTNDCKTQFETDAKEIANGLLLITKQALETNPNLTICIVSPIHINPVALNLATYYTRESIYISQELSNAYQNMAINNGYHFIDAAHIATADSRDGEHLNLIGHKALGTTLYQSLTSL